MYTQSVLSKNMKKDKRFQLKIVIFTAVKNRCILHGRVFVMQGEGLYVHVQRRWGFVVNDFRIFELVFVCIVVAICDLVHAVETMHGLC